MINLVGKRFGRLTVVSKASSQISGTQVRSFWKCRCECGTEKDVNADALRRGLTKSCGCLKRDVDAAITHGLCKSPEYNTWNSAKGRCYNPQNKRFLNYGGRGIIMCSRWRNDFAKFFKDMGPRPANATLDRRNVNGNYTPKNCRWLKNSNQPTNTTRTIWVKLGERRVCLSRACKILGIAYQAVWRHMSVHGVTGDEAIAHYRNE